MKLRNAAGSVLSDDTLLFVFYIFMLLCGFVAGTMIWSKLDIPIIAAEYFTKSATLTEMAVCITIPAAGTFAGFLVLALFAGGWMIFPIAVYILGAAFGCFSCSLFFAQADLKSTVFHITLTAAYLCCAAVLMYFCVFAHQLSRGLSGGGEDCIPAYRRCLRSAVISALLIVAVAVIFSGIIFAFSL